MGVGIVGTLFSKKVPFLANIERCGKFLEFYRSSSGSVVCSSCKNTFFGDVKLQMMISKS